MNQPFDFPRAEVRGLPFGLSSGRGLSLPAPPSVGTGAGRKGLILSGAFHPVLKDGVWRRRSIKKGENQWGS
ncbi:MAG: hypothetical protein MUP41_13480 [Desulfobacterales bacterium]|nr:hypothetical protein [Desulfobacterales bacterium]